MTSLWVIIRTETIVSDPEYGLEDPTVCGIYPSKEEAVEEILKLYIEDDLDFGNSDLSDNKEDIDTAGEPVPVEEEPENPIDYSQYRPTPESVQEQRQFLLKGETYNTYTNLGNAYTLVECVLGAKHEFEEDVLEMYQESLQVELSSPDPSDQSPDQ